MYKGSVNVTKTDEEIPLITLVGPPNSGKTTLFNYLSGKNYKTVNYPGSTVEYSVCRIHDRFSVKADILDSPGIISLIPNSPDEEVTVNSLYSHPKLGTPKFVIVTVDASQLSRHLLLAKQLLDAGFNVIIALTMLDILEKKELKIESKKLSEILKCDVVEIDGRTGKGTDKLLTLIDSKLRDDVKSREIKNYSNFINTHELLKTYEIIETIENDVLEEKIYDKIDLKTANKQLKVLNETAAKKSIYRPDEFSLKLDKIFLHKTWGLLTFFLIMSFTFTAIFWLALPVMNGIDSIFGFLADEAVTLLGSNWMGDFVSDGIITGTGAVLVFLPQIAILFLILGVLEDSGYLARGAMLIDKPLSKIGLNGRSFVPMLSGFACAIPAMMAARTIPNKRERLLTIFILPLMSCSARLPVYALLIAFLLPTDKVWMGGLALAAIYIFSTVSSITVAGIINKFKDKFINEQDESSFILELPAYRKPKLDIVLNNTYISSKAYLKKAGPIILTFSILLWLLTYFPNYNPQVDTTNRTQDEISQMQNAERLQSSYAADLGKIIQPVMTPLGMDWRVGVSLIAAFSAREVFVSSLALIFKVTSTDNALQQSIVKAMRQAKIEGTNQKLFTPATIIGLIIFFIFALQCLSTVAVSRKETGSWRIPILQLITFTSMAYILSFLTVNGLRLIGIN